MQILEMFGSSCDVHLEMPVSTEDENELFNWWIIPPYQSKAIAKVHFLAMRATNVTAFVRYMPFLFNQMNYSWRNNEMKQ